MLRQMATVGSGTALSRLLGFLRDILFGALLGAGAAADAFFAAFQIISITRRLLAEGALNATLVPAYMQARETGHGPAFAGRMLATFSAILFALAVLAGLAMPWLLRLLTPGFAGDARIVLASDFARWMLPYLAFAGPVTVIAGLLNAHRRFAATAFAPLLFNGLLIAMAAAILVLDLTRSQAGLALACVVGLAGFGQLIVLGTGLASTGISATPLRMTFDKPMRRFLARTLPAIAAGTLPQAAMVIGAIAASGTGGAVSWLYFANRLIEFPLGLVSVAMGMVLTPALMQARLDGDDDRMLRMQAAELAFGLSLPAAIGLALLAEPITHTLFAHGAFTAADAAQTATLLVILAAGLPGQALAKALGPAYFARGEVMMPFYAMIAGLLATGIAIAVLKPVFGLAAVAIAIVLAGWTAALCLLRPHAATRATPRFVVLQRFARIAGAGLVMAVALILARQILPLAPAATLALRATSLAVLIALGFVVYIAALRAVGVVPSGTLGRVLRRRTH